MVWTSICEAPRPGRRFRCPCCKYLTLSSRGYYEICKVCFWEDDGQDEHDADIVRGGPNAELSLRQAQDNYRTFGATEKRFLKYVRPPRAEEMQEEK